MADSKFRWITKVDSESIAGMKIQGLERRKALEGAIETQKKRKGYEAAGMHRSVTNP